MGRRELLKLPAMAAAYGLLPRSAMALPAEGGAPMDEADPEGTKIAIKLTVQHTTDEELLFLKQIGLRWLHADFGEEHLTISLRPRRNVSPGMASRSTAR